jgi:hypothetical protein
MKVKHQANKDQEASNRHKNNEDNWGGPHQAKRFNQEADCEADASAGNKLAYSLHSLLLGLVEVGSLSTLPPPSREGST